MSTSQIDKSVYLTWIDFHGAVDMISSNGAIFPGNGDARFTRAASPPLAHGKDFPLLKRHALLCLVLSLAGCGGGAQAPTAPGLLTKTMGLTPPLPITAALQ